MSCTWTKAAFLAVTNSKIYNIARRHTYREQKLLQDLQVLKAGAHLSQHPFHFVLPVIFVHVAIAISIHHTFMKSSCTV